MLLPYPLHSGSSMTALPEGVYPLLHYLVTAMLLPLGVYALPLPGDSIAAPPRCVLPLALHSTPWGSDCSPYRCVCGPPLALRPTGMSFHCATLHSCPPSSSLRLLLSLPPISLPRTFRYDWTVVVKEGKKRTEPFSSFNGMEAGKLIEPIILKTLPRDGGVGN